MEEIECPNVITVKLKRALFGQRMQWFLCFSIINQEVYHHQYLHITARIVGMC